MADIAGAAPPAWPAPPTRVRFEDGPPPAAASPSESAERVTRAQAKYRNPLRASRGLPVAPDVTEEDDVAGAARAGAGDADIPDLPTAEQLTPEEFPALENVSARYGIIRVPINMVYLVEGRGRLGRAAPYERTLQPGLRRFISMFERIAHAVHTGPQTASFAVPQVFTRENVPVDFAVHMTYAIRDALLATRVVSGVRGSLARIASTAVRKHVSAVSIDSVIVEIPEMYRVVTEDVNKAGQVWGACCYRITAEAALPPQLVDGYTELALARLHREAVEFRAPLSDCGGSAPLPPPGGDSIGARLAAARRRRPKPQVARRDGPAALETPAAPAPPEAPEVIRTEAVHEAAPAAPAQPEAPEAPEEIRADAVREAAFEAARIRESGAAHAAAVADLAGALSRRGGREAARLYVAMRYIDALAGGLTNAGAQVSIDASGGRVVESVLGPLGAQLGASRVASLIRAAPPPPDLATAAAANPGSDFGGSSDSGGSGGGAGILAAEPLHELFAGSAPGGTPGAMSAHGTDGSAQDGAPGRAGSAHSSDSASSLSRAPSDALSRLSASGWDGPLSLPDLVTRAQGPACAGAAGGGGARAASGSGSAGASAAGLGGGDLRALLSGPASALWELLPRRGAPRAPAAAAAAAAAAAGEEPQLRPATRSGRLGRARRHCTGSREGDRRFPLPAALAGWSPEEETEIQVPTALAAWPPEMPPGTADRETPPAPPRKPFSGWAHAQLRVSSSDRDGSSGSSVRRPVPRRTGSAGAAEIRPGVVRPGSPVPRKNKGLTFRGRRSSGADTGLAE